MTYKAGLLRGGGGGASSWASISGKPSVFPPEAHEQAISTVTGLQDELDAKQIAGNYAAASHSHIIADVADLQAALDSKQNVGGGSDPWTYVKLATTATATTTASVDTNLRFAPPANSVVIFEAQLFLQAALTTTGARPGLKWPTAGVLQNIARAESPNTATAGALRYWGNTAAASAAATGVPVANEGIYGAIEGTLVTGATVTGNLIITLASEIAGSEARIMANSWLRYRTI